MRRLTLALLLFAAPAWADGPTDARLGPPVTLDGHFPFRVPPDLKAWEARQEQVRRQLRVSLGLYPEPPRTPLNPVLRGEIERDGYVIRKATFESVPGHHVTGSLYVPAAPSPTGKYPAILCPHGHWADGRMHVADSKDADKAIAQGGERTPEGARYFMQAMCVQLARMGFVVLQYDMVGYADSLAIPHAEGFADADAEWRLHSAMSLQTWNSIRALDFVCSLPLVDAARVGATGASGGGTQTFILGALDDRLAAACPMVMVSTGMQGGCVCENASFLRVGTGNVELAGLFAPRPMSLTGANDWTIDFEKDGLPQLQALYGLYGKRENVEGKVFPQFPHNYNVVSRERMYRWFNRHLLGKDEAVTEGRFEPTPPKQLSVWDAERPMPKTGDAAAVRAYWRERDADAKSADLAPVLETWFGDAPAAPAVAERLPAKWNGRVVVWASPAGRAALADDPTVAKLVEGGAAIVACDFLKHRPVDRKFAGYTFGYNRPILAERARDLWAAVRAAKARPGCTGVSLVGLGESGVPAAFAALLAGGDLERVAVDWAGADLEKPERTDHPLMLPGWKKYGGLPMLAERLRATGKPVSAWNGGERPAGLTAFLNP